MKNNTLKILGLILALFFATDATYAQTAGKAGGNQANFFNTSSFGGQLGHRQLGQFGQFTANSRWIAIGQPANVSTEFYGMRIQDRGNQATFSLNGNGVKDLEIQWGSDADSRLNFNFATSNFTKTSVMSLDPFGRLDASNRIRANSSNTNTAEYTEIGHGGVSGYINTVGDGFLDFRHDGTTKMRLTDTGRLGINRSSVSFTLDVNGNARNTTGVWSTSDRRFKKNIERLSATTEKLLQLEGVSYQFKKEKIGSLDLSYVDDKTHIGFIAQDLAQQFPELVLQDEEGFYAVRYEGLIPVIVEGMKNQQEIIEEQATTIDALNDRVAELERQVASVLKAIEGGSVPANQGTTAKFSVNDKASTVLGQNRPNPFTDRTFIDFQLPADTQNAELVIHHTDGRQISRYNLSGQEGSVELDASQLAKGTYVYSLMVDGKVLSQKTMVVQ
ncbi:MAG: tail fiber domain-containing protein [Bacteroidota bacterium]